jgi:Tol biopolymer transport system component
MALAAMACVPSAQNSSASLGAQNQPAIASPEAAGDVAFRSPTASLGMVAFVADADIWTKALPSGEAQRLTADGKNREPRWSPSGQWLLILKEKEFWVLDQRGEGARSLGTAEPVWDRKADRLAYLARDGTFVLEDAGGFNRVEISPPAPAGAVQSSLGNPRWSPDGEWLAFSRADALTEAGQGQPPVRYASLWRVRADGGGSVQVLDAGRPSPDGLEVADWSPDGVFILYWVLPSWSGSGRSDGLPLFAIPAQGGNTRELQPWPKQAVLTYPDFRTWSPSGDRLALIEGNPRGAWAHKRLAVVDIVTGARAYLTDEQTAASSPAWSPDGQRIAYVAMADEGDLVGGETARRGLARRRIRVLDANGLAHSLTHDDAYRDERPIWSADGSSILFARLDDADRASLWLMPADGGEPVEVVDQLSPNPSTPAAFWFGYYGHINWEQLFDYWPMRL